MEQELRFLRNHPSSSLFRVVLSLFFFISDNRCSPNPCANGGKCVGNSYGYKCICRPGYSGNKCQSQFCIYDFVCSKSNGLYSTDSILLSSSQQSYLWVSLHICSILSNLGFSVFVFVIVLSVLRITVSDKTFCIFKLYLMQCVFISCINENI